MEFFFKVKEVNRNEKIEFYADLGYVGADCKEIVEVPDDDTEEDIEEMFECWLSNHLDCGFTKIEEE